jgi:YD repeat-containing protein
MKDKLTVAQLKHHDACKEGIDFAIRNKLIGFPLDMLSDIKGDYKNFIIWVKQSLDEELLEFDEYGNCITIRDWDGYENTFEFDEHGNKTFEFNEGEHYSCAYVYDKNNNLISKNDSYDDGSSVFTYDSNNRLTMSVEPMNTSINPYITWYSYDEHGNISQKRDSNGYSTTFQYDDHNNIVRIKYYENTTTNYNVEEFNITYYPDGQLKSYGGLYIPYFEKDL